VVTPELVAAIAATVAAILSGFGLWVGAVREERTWRREALVDTIVQFLAAGQRPRRHPVVGATGPRGRYLGGYTASARAGPRDAAEFPPFCAGDPYRGRRS
jgi:hypothetical protein